MKLVPNPRNDRRVVVIVPPRSRNSDPDTSHDAGEEFERLRRFRPEGPHHIALRPFEDAYDGLTAPEMQDAVGGGIDNMETARKRVNELERAHLIKKNGKKRPNYRSTRRRQCYVYVITIRGSTALRRLDRGEIWP